MNVHQGRNKNKVIIQDPKFPTKASVSFSLGGKLKSEIVISITVQFAAHDAGPTCLAFFSLLFVSIRSQIKEKGSQKSNNVINTVNQETITKDQRIVELLYLLTC